MHCPRCPRTMQSRPAVIAEDLLVIGWRCDHCGHAMEEIRVQTAPGERPRGPIRYAVSAAYA